MNFLNLEYLGISKKLRLLENNKTLFKSAKELSIYIVTDWQILHPKSVLLELALHQIYKSDRLSQQAFFVDLEKLILKCVEKPARGTPAALT